MAAFVMFSNSQEKTTNSYKELIQRLQREAELEAEEEPSLVRATNYQYYCAHKDRKGEHGIKDYIYHLTMKTFEGGAGLLICENPLPTFKHFICLIEQVKEPDGINSDAYYYGEIKNIITGFMNYFTALIDETAKKINKHTHFIDNKLLVELIDETIELYENNHRSFLKQYLPLNSEIEKENYQQVKDEHANFLKELGQIRDVWEVRQHELEDFAKKTFQASIQKISDLCNLTHTYISVMLADRLYEMGVSIEETTHRLKTNLEKCKEDYTHEKNMLFQNLYERNKEYLHINRRIHDRSTDTAEVSSTMDLVRAKIKNIGNEETLARLELESRFWNQRLKEFNEIASTLIRIQIELENLEADRKKYKSVTCMELLGSKTVCFDLMGENIDDRISYLQKKQVEMSRAIITFFYVRDTSFTHILSAMLPQQIMDMLLLHNVAQLLFTMNTRLNAYEAYIVGTNRVLYTDRIGSFYVDEFNHQNYITNYGSKYFHVNCYGEFLENSESTPYYFDDNGRYILDENGEKTYQVAACTSQYKLGEDGLFKKITKDCGHSERPNPDCRLEDIKDLTDKVILPRNHPIDITGTLDHESVKFLWDSFGMFLPEVLYEVATKQPKNPIHSMAHILLKRKFEASAADLRKMRKNAMKYRHDMTNKQKDKAIEERRAWKGRLMPRRKPEHYDNYHERAANHLAMDRQIADTMGHYYN